MFLTMADVEEKKTGTVTVGSDASSITVYPKGPSGTGVFTDTINKDAADNGDSVRYGDYDYSEGYGDSAAQIGILRDDPGSIKYRLYVNNKGAEISHVTVTDRLPDGMEFDSAKAPEVTDRATGAPVDPDQYSISLSGNTLVFTWPGTLRDTLQINYWVIITSEDPLAGKYTNRADITYEQDGEPYAEHRNYILQGSDYSAANGEKSVDKTEISDDPDDQLVTYTIKFWNQSGFSAGEIVLEDILDEHVRFVSANANDYFSITQDEDDPQIIHLENRKDIPGTATVYVRFTCDFSDVPVGYTVVNTVGGNSTKTRKVGGKVVLNAAKTVDGKDPAPDQTFAFELLDQEGNILQTSRNEGRKITFDAITYGREDLGKTYVYQIREKPDQESDYIMDDAVCTATVQVASAPDADGRIGTTVSLQKNGADVDEAVFDNRTASVSVPVSKVWDDSADQDGIRPGEVTVKLLADGSDTGRTLVLGEDNHWEGTFSALAQYHAGKEIVYTVEEVPVQGYTTFVEGEQQTGYRVINTHVPETIEVQGSKRWDDDDDRDGVRPERITIRLLADGEEIESKEITAADEWSWHFTDLPKNRDGNTIAYTVTEDAVPGYSAEIDGEQITNHHTPGQISLTVTKKWEDDQNREGLRPDHITVSLLADGEAPEREDAEIQLDEQNNWTYTWERLPKKADGASITYTVEEKESVDGYTKSITGDMEKGYVITNTREEVPAEPSYTVRKSSDTAGEKVTSGDRITYTIEVKNTGDTDLTGIWVRDYVPAYTRFISAEQGGQRGAIDGKQHVDWFIGTLESGGTTHVSFTVEVVTCVPAGTVIRNAAYTQDTEKPKKPELNHPSKSEGPDK